MKTQLFFLLLLSHFCFAQNPKPFKTCSKTVNYTVDDWELRKKVGMELLFPDCNSSYVGGTKELMNYFKANSIDDCIYIFRTFISFTVNCIGQVGDFEFMSNEKENVRRQQVFDVVKKMPQRWMPAVSKQGKSVDSYQRIIVTVKGSKFLDVDYK